MTTALEPQWLIVEDAEDEIFDLYVRKNDREEGQDIGLGFVESKTAVLSVPLDLVGPVAPSKPDKKSRSKAIKAHSQREIRFVVQVSQDLNGLHRRSGDTGSVLWRVSIHFAKLLLYQHHFRPARPLLPIWTPSSTVLELGSGSGFLGVALRETVAKWTFTDQIDNLELVRRNLRKNGIQDGNIEELDWLVESRLWVFEGHNASSSRAASGTQRPDIIVAADCIYNSFLSEALAHTIDRQAGPSTMAIVASELRDSEPLELFLKTWVSIGWQISRLVVDKADQSGLGSQSFVVWLGKRMVQ